MIQQETGIFQLALKVLRWACGLVPVQNTCAVLGHFIWTFIGLNQLYCLVNTLTPFVLGKKSVADSMGGEIMKVEVKSLALAQQVSL